MTSSRNIGIILSLLRVSISFSLVIKDGTHYSPNPLGIASTVDTTSAAKAKETLINLVKSGQDENSPTLSPYLHVLQESYSASNIDARYSQNPDYNGDWENVNTPAFQGRLGFASDGLPLYTIGRLTFNQIPSAKDVVCAVEKMVQHVHLCETIPSIVPDFLQATLEKNPQELRSNQIDTLFQIPDSSVRGILRMEGYTLPNDQDSNKYDTWFLGGRCLPQDGVSMDDWNKIFEGKLDYSLSSPMAAYQTVIYLDDTLRVSVGNRGTIMIVQKE